MAVLFTTPPFVFGESYETVMKPSQEVQCPVSTTAS